MSRAVTYPRVVLRLPPSSVARRSNHVGRRKGAIDCACRPSASIPRHFILLRQFNFGMASLERVVCHCLMLLTKVRPKADVRPSLPSNLRCNPGWLVQEAYGRDDHRPTASAVELANQPVKLLGVLHEHEVRTALVLLEDFGLPALDLFPDPDLRLPRNEARFAAHNQSWDVDHWNEVSPIVGGVIEQQACRIFSWKL